MRARCELVNPEHDQLSVRRQCELLGLNRSSYYYEPYGESVENLELMRRMDELYMQRPYFGARRMGRHLGISRERAGRLMRLMGIEALYPKKKTTRRNAEHKVYPYLLRDIAIDRCDQVWSSDITYVPLSSGYMYLTAVIDWYSRYVLSWQLSNTLDGRFSLTRSRRHCPGDVSRRYSIRTMGANTPAMNSRDGSRNTISRSAWTAVAGRRTMCSKGGGHLNVSTGSDASN